MLGLKGGGGGGGGREGEKNKTLHLTTFNNFALVFSFLLLVEDLFVKFLDFCLGIFCYIKQYFCFFNVQSFLFAAFKLTSYLFYAVHLRRTSNCDGFYSIVLIFNTQQGARVAKARWIAVFPFPERCLESRNCFRVIWSTYCELCF